MDIASSSKLKISSDATSDQLVGKMREMALKDSEELLKAHALSLGLGYVNLKAQIIVEECFAVIPEEAAKRLRVICFDFVRHRTMRIACHDYSDEVKALIKELEEQFETQASVYLTSEDSFFSAFAGYARVPKLMNVEEVLIDEQEVEQLSREFTSLDEVKKRFEHASVTDVLTVMLAAALKFLSSDVHIEDGQDGTEIRFRIDGVLHAIATLPRELGKHLISRVKLTSGLKINVSDHPQDGHFDIRIGGEKIDVRASSLPTNYGESVALRVLQSSAQHVTFERLGMFPWTREFLEKESARPAGLFVICGPTGSGKTTSIYSVIMNLNTPDVKILTIEDPIEYEMKGVSQSRVDEAHGYTFAKGLRSLVRQDPDVIVVGEIRDAETVDIALQASLTGHLVLSTLHTNSSAGTIPRFLAMGAKPYLLSPALNSIMSQRLVRKLCESCKESRAFTSEEEALVQRKIPRLRSYMEKLGISEPKAYAAKGCPKCGGIGYQGRIGVFEQLSKTVEIEKEILSSSVSEVRIRELQRAQVTPSMFEDGILKCFQGITSLDEVLRVVDEKD